MPEHIRDRLLVMIGDYQRLVREFVFVLRARYGVDHPLEGVRAGVIPQRGMLDDRHETRFSFHGIGCRTESDEGEVDFDFGPEGRHDGFDAYRLHVFAQSLPEKYPELQQIELVERALEELLHTDLIISPRWMPSPHLMYFTEAAAGPRAEQLD